MLSISSFSDYFDASDIFYSSNSYSLEDYDFGFKQTGFLEDFFNLLFYFLVAGLISSSLSDSISL